MAEFLNVMIPLMAAMLSPIWLPLTGVALGKALDSVRPQPMTPVQAVVEAAKARSVALRAERPVRAVTTRRLPATEEQLAA